MRMIDLARIIDVGIDSSFEDLRKVSGFGERFVEVGGEVDVGEGREMTGVEEGRISQVDRFRQKHLLRNDFELSARCQPIVRSIGGERDER